MKLIFIYLDPTPASTRPYFGPQRSPPLHPTALTSARCLLSWDSLTLLLQIRSSCLDSPNTWFALWRKGSYVYTPYTNSLPRTEWRIQEALTYLLQMLAKTEGTVFDSANECQWAQLQWLPNTVQLFIYFSYTQKLNYSWGSMISIFRHFQYFIIHMVCKKIFYFHLFGFNMVTIVMIL